MGCIVYRMVAYIFDMQRIFDDITILYVVTFTVYLFNVHMTLQIATAKRKTFW